MNTFISADLIFFILVAAFLIIRLRSVLGRRTGNEKKPKDMTSFYLKQVGANKDLNDKQQSIKERFNQNQPIKKSPSKNISDLEKLHYFDRSFTPKKFLSGAKVAFQTIIQSYAKGEISKIKYLLSTNVFSTFSKEIKYRIKKKYILEHTLVSLKSAGIEKINIKSTIADIVVKFVSEQVNLLKNQKGKILKGNDEYIESHTNYWTFSKDLKSSNPNWKLVVTKAE